MSSTSQSYGCALQKSRTSTGRRYSTVPASVFFWMSQSASLCAEVGLTVLLVLTLLGCDRIVHVDGDQTNISAEILTKQRESQRDLNLHRNVVGFGNVIDGVTMQTDVAPKAIGRLAPLNLSEKLVELYLAAASQTPMQREQFHKIEELEWEAGDYPALLWWWDAEARLYPDAAADIKKLKERLPAIGKGLWIDGGVTINLVAQSGDFNPAILDDFQREEPGTKLRIYCLDNSDQIQQLVQAEATIQRTLGASTPPHAFDIAMVTDSALGALAAKGLLAPISETGTVEDRELQVNLGLIDKDFRKWISRQGSWMKIDLGRYCIPYYWSLTGIAYNSAFVDKLPLSWAALFSPIRLHTDSTQFGRTSMLREPKQAIKTALLYLANREVEPPDLRTIESVERLLNDSAAVCKRLPDLINGPESEFLIADLTCFLNHLREPLGHSPDELARMLSRVQDEIVWLLLKLDLKRPSTEGQNASSAGIELKRPSLSPLGPPIPIAGGSLSEVVTSMRQLTLITYDDLYSAVSFLKRLADIEHRIDLLLETKGQENIEIKTIKAAAQTLGTGLNSEQPQPPNEIAAGFASVQQRADALLDPGNSFDPEGKLTIAIDLLFRGPGTTDVVKTANSVLLLAQQDPSDNALADLDTRSKIDAAFSYLRSQASYVSYFFTDADTVTALDSGKVILGQASGRDATLAALKNEHIGFALPGEGVLGAAECFVVLDYAGPRDKRTFRGCLQFLNYLLKPENAAKMVNYSKYASTESAAATFIDRAVLNGACYMRPPDLSTVSLLTSSNDEMEKMYARAAVPLETSKVLLEHPEYKKIRSLFGVLFQVHRPN
jgi:spermidine/putrescine-binding protein